MATRKSAPSKGASKKSAKKSAKKGGSVAASATRAGTVPPYGEPIRSALARGDNAEMRRVAANARKYLREVQAALGKLDKALGK